MISHLPGSFWISLKPRCPHFQPHQALSSWRRGSEADRGGWRAAHRPEVTAVEGRRLPPAEIMKLQQQQKCRFSTLMCPVKTFLIVQIERHQQLLSIISKFVHFTSFCSCLRLSTVYKAGFFTHFHSFSQFFFAKKKTNRKSINVTDEFLLFFSGMSSYSKWNPQDFTSPFHGGSRWRCRSTTDNGAKRHIWMHCEALQRRRCRGRLTLTILNGQDGLRWCRGFNLDAHLKGADVKAS